jgi:hypothetical protein
MVEEVGGETMKAPMIELHLYGDLRRYAQERTIAGHSVVRLPVGNGKTVGGVLREVGIDPTIENSVRGIRWR